MADEKVKVKVVKLDDLVKEYNFGFKPGALWIDVEGYQKQVLEGAKDYFDNPKLLIVKIEVESLELFKKSTSIRRYR